ncbi:MAG TPA: AAA domain-containing protein [Clostridia bacterium]|nr:AAA domain-containing protein [Clostridia bacterium]
MADLLTKQDKLFDNIDDVIDILSRKNGASRPPAFLWRKVTHKVHVLLLGKIAKELGLPNPRFIASKDLEKHRFKFLNDTPLNGLYSYYKNSFPRKKGVHIITNVCNQLDIPEVTVDEWIYFIGKNNIFSWRNIPNAAKRAILLGACDELGYTHPIFIRNEDFSIKFKFLNDLTLTGFYNYYKKKYDDIRGSTIINMCTDLDISITKDDWISYMTDSSISVFWDVIPHKIIRDILYQAAETLGYSNPRMMSIDDLKVDLPFLKNTNLYSFASRFFGLDRGGIGNIDYICDVYGVSELSYEEWISIISFQNNFKWESIPLAYIGRILQEKAKELGKSNPRILKHEDLNTPSPFINNKTLSSLYAPYSQKAAQEGLDTITYICNISGIPHLSRDEWFSIIKEPNIKISWESMENHIKREIIISAARELHLGNPRLMGYKDFCNTRFDFLNNKTLGGLYYHYSSKVRDDQTSVVQFMADELNIEKLSINAWITMIANTNICHWESVPINVQREIVMRAAREMGIFHPRLMGTKELDSVPIKFLNNKTLAGLYYHYSSKVRSPHISVNEFIFDNLNIPRIDINPRTGRLSTLDSISHRKYFDSRANIKDFFNLYLKHFDLKSLCRKHIMLKNSRNAGIYRKGLVTILASMNRREYVDFLFDILKNTPRDTFGLRKPRGKGDYRLLRSDLYHLAGLDYEESQEPIKIELANPQLVEVNEKQDVLDKLKTHMEILDIRIKKFHEVQCDFLVSYRDSYIFSMPISLFPGEILTCDSDWEYEVIECRDKKNNDGYIVELQTPDGVPESLVSEITTFTRDSNSSILFSHLERIVNAIEKDTLPPLFSIVLGLKKEKTLKMDDIKMLPNSSYYNKDLVNNTAQKQAVSLASSMDGRDHALTLVQGPPGTGKTTLIKETALQYYHQGKDVLILAKTNIAVDNILEKLVEDNVRALRTGNNIESKSDLPYIFTVSSSNPEYTSLLEGTNSIVLGTPLGYYLDRNMEIDSFDLVIIDEASQMDMPETLFSLQFSDKCVIIGDHMQIPPFPIQNEILLDYNPDIDLGTREDLQKSLFESLITDEGRYNSIFLDINYRTQNPLMVSFISDLIYDGKLSTNLDSEYYQLPPVKRKRVFPSNPIEIIDTSEFIGADDRMETEVNSTFYNLSEAMISIERVMDLVKQGEALDDISIITPYKAHVEKLKEIFKEKAMISIGNSRALNQFVEKNIHTIDSFQGREQDNIIINWVRSNNSSHTATTRTGFLKDYRRNNVALSRARERLILVGDFHTLTRSENMKVQYIFSKIKKSENEGKIVL